VQAHRTRRRIYHNDQKKVSELVNTNDTAGEERKIRREKEEVELMKP
jgi:hypothetical protein